MASQDEIYDESDIKDQEIGMSARLGNPEIPDVQEPEPDPPQPRIRQFYTATRVFNILLIVGSLLSGWISYGLMPVGKFLNKECDTNLEVWKKRFMILQVIGTLIALAQFVNIAYQLKANGFDMYKLEEPLNYVDGRSEVLFVLLLVFLPQMSIMTELDSRCRLNTTSTDAQYCGDTANVPRPEAYEKIRDSADVNARIAYAILGFLSIHFRFIFSRALPRFGKKGVTDDFKAYKLKKTMLLKIILFLDKKIPRILKFVGLDFICICRKLVLYICSSKSI
ncbi:uncharacterized protein LOC134258879 [Saccostrea cucullata]|uniref:uncharacterized protein LOC134258879 n=1 Tax=Saccostrea cuccullata TaxID=36930 RepID=UPI002ED44465